MTEIDNYRKIKRFCKSFKDFCIYDYLYFIGITNIKKDLEDTKIKELIEICDKADGNYSDPITLAEDITHSIYKAKYITLEELKNVPSEDLDDIYFEGKICLLKNYSKTNCNVEMEVEK